MLPAKASSSAQSPPPFQLHWTIGFTGKRFLHDGSDQRSVADAKAARALSQAVQFLHEKATQQDSKLTAVSSIARGADVLFAKACLTSDTQQPAIPWKCLLPFSKDAFFLLDLAKDSNGTDLPPDEIRRLRQGAETCLQKAYETDAASPDAYDYGADSEQRAVAYLECGYRTVNESDVMICLLRGAEFKTLAVGVDARGVAAHGSKPAPQCLKAGTMAVARYAIATQRPCILLDLDADDPWRSRVILNAPKDKKGHLFVDPVVSGLIGRARDPFRLPLDFGEMPPGPDTDSRRSVLHLQKRLGGIANTHQRRSQRGLKWMLSLHLAATGIAALSVTVLRVTQEEAHRLALPLVIGLLALAFTKPILTFWAQQIEHFLYHHGDRDHWLHARELAELCRGAISLWPLPIQPLDAVDEDDFPKLKRLLRTLRIMRTLDTAAPVRGTQRAASPDATRHWEGETALEADMRAASDIYITSRLLHQADFYKKQHCRSRALERRWHCVYLSAIWSATGCGLVLALIYAFHMPHGSPAYADIYSWLAAVVIIAPFVASFALGMMTILDCRRRSCRYDEMYQYLTKLAATLKSCLANSSRLRIIGHAERMLFEEQHEWFSVTRNYSV